MTLLPLALLISGPIADVPFELVGNRVYLKATLNGRPVNAVLDTGAGTTVADDVVGDSAGAKKVQEIVAGGAGEKQIKAWVVSNLNLRLVDTEIRQPIQVILPLAPLTAMEGRPLETVLGYDFLRRYRVEIDYAAGRVRLFDSDEESVPAGAVSLPVNFVQNLPQVKGQIDIPGIGVKDVTMMLDTGATSAFSITNRLATELKLAERFKSSPEIVIGGGVGGETKGRRIRLAWATLADSKFTRPVAQLDASESGATGKGASYDVLVGGETFRRFTLTLDYAHKRIFLKPNAAIGEPFIGDHIGLALTMAEGGGFAVRQIVPSSPASEAGLLTGDVLLAVDGKVPMSLDEARRILRTASGEVKLRIRRADKEQELVLKSREMIP